jgi:hypothetical protein
MKRDYNNKNDLSVNNKNTQNTLNLHDLDNYSFIQLLDIFDLNPNLTIEDLKIARKKVASLHPDKNNTNSNENFLFFRRAYEIIISNYVNLNKQNMKIPDEKINYNVDSEYISKNITVENEINKIEKKDFNKRFNKIFNEKIIVPENNDLKWFHEDDLKMDELKNVKDIHNTFEKLRNERNGLIIYNDDFNALYGGSNSLNSKSLYDDNETDKNGYITCNPFDKLKYDDITRVHRDQIIIPVQNSEFIRANKERNLNQYKIDYNVMEKTEAENILNEQTIKYNNYIKEKNYQMNQKTSKYEKINNEILSQFLLLK